MQGDDVKSIKLSASRARRRLIPSLPTDLKETQHIISDLKLRTKFGEDFVTLNNETGNFVIFTTNKNVELLTLSNYLYIDGTFDCVKFSTQLCTLHGYFTRHIVPLVYSLLENKTNFQISLN